MSVKRYDQAEKALQEIGRVNQRPLSGRVFTEECRKEMVNPHSNVTEYFYKSCSLGSQFHNGSWKEFIDSQYT